MSRPHCYSRRTFSAKQRGRIRQSCGGHSIESAAHSCLQRIRFCLNSFKGLRDCLEGAGSRPNLWNQLGRRLPAARHTQTDIQSCGPSGPERQFSRTQEILWHLQYKIRESPEPDNDTVRMSVLIFIKGRAIETNPIFPDFCG